MRSLFGLAALAGLVVAQSNSTCSPRTGGTWQNKPIWTQPSGRVSYPRVAELSDGTLLATIGWRDPTPGTLAYFPVFESKDEGATWKWISNITDQVNGLGMWAQPAIYELPYDVGDYPKGTVLSSGNSAGNRSTIIDLYASLDKGYSWDFVSNVARGGRPNTTNGADPIWEPFLLAYGGTMGTFYSDQRDPLHGQKLAHQESADLKTWGPVINDVAYANYTVRPGMTVIAYLPPIDKWIFVYEYPPNAGGINYYSNTYPVFYKLVADPYKFDYADGVPIIANNSAPNASPYVVWSPSGGVNGTIIVSDADNRDVWTNQHVGRPDKWVRRIQPGRPAYSRALHVSGTNPDRLFVFSGSTFDDDPPGVKIPFLLTALSVEKLLVGGYDDVVPDV